mgnify:CR=1 FL=1|tara:strand:+ start:3179 stop:3514 length:336 start_codon:yes stop_codon:yes gene_type:complete
MANAFKSVSSQSVGTTQVSVYECPAATSTTIIGMTIANTNTAQITVDVQMKDASNSDTQIHIVKDAPIPVGGSLVVIGGDQKVVFEVSDSMNVTSDTTTSADVILSFLEIT